MQDFRHCEVDETHYQQTCAAHGLLSNVCT